LSRSFEVIQDLIPELTKEVYLRSAEELIADRYEFFAIEHDAQIVSVARVRISSNLSAEKFMWLYTFVTKEEHRRKGYGRRLLDGLEKYALDNHCVSIRLHTGTMRSDAHAFYRNQGYGKRYYVFYKDLGNEPEK
jgi:GNAT superfamily N-acetyltransferase